MPWPSEEEIESQLNNMSVEELEKLVDNIHYIAKFLVNDELKKILARKVANLDSRLSTQERKYRIGYGVKKSIRGQESDDDDTEKKWPSVTQVP